MSTQHTPGPWVALPEEVDKDYLRIRGTKLGGRYKIANVHTPIHDNVILVSSKESFANARLIAAAPELLEVLRLVADLSSTQWQESDGSMRGATDNRGRMMHFINIDVMKEVDAAIAKALGEKND